MKDYKPRPIRFLEVFKHKDWAKHILMKNEKPDFEAYLMEHLNGEF